MSILIPFQFFRIGNNYTIYKGQFLRSFPNGVKVIRACKIKDIEKAKKNKTKPNYEIITTWKPIQILKAVK